MKDELQSTLAGAYTIERELGGGGQSRVFLARDLALDRSVVIKVLPPETAGTVSAERFNREIRLAAQLQHAHIVSLLSAGTSAPSMCSWSGREFSLNAPALPAHRDLFRLRLNAIAFPRPGVI